MTKPSDQPRGNRLLGKMMVTFVIDGTAKVSEIKVESLADFRRVAPKADTTTGVSVAVADVQKFVGKFGAKDVPFTVDVQMVGSALKTSVPGQPSYTLVPVSPYTLDGRRVKSVKWENPAPQPTLVLTPVS